MTGQQLGVLGGQSAATWHAVPTPTHDVEQLDDGAEFDFRQQSEPGQFSGPSQANGKPFEHGAGMHVADGPQTQQTSLPVHVVAPHATPLPACAKSLTLPACEKSLTLPITARGEGLIAATEDQGEQYPCAS
jgi:hypothetical protein